MNLFVSLRYLVALDEHKHFGRAALACHVTQPALSNAVRALEDHFGTAIVKRGRSFSGLSLEGERILDGARRMLREHELMQQDLHSSAGKPSGQLLIGVVPTAMPIAARFAARLQQVHPGIVPRVRSMSSVVLESELDSMAIDMGLGYTERVDASRSPLRVLPQYLEHYFLLRASETPGAPGLRIGAPMRWQDAAALPLCLLSPEMHNRTIVERAFAQAGARVAPAIETNSILTLALSVVAGQVCSVMPGALVDAVKGYGEMQAHPLMDPVVEISIAFLVPDVSRPTRTLAAALEYANSSEWLAHASQHAGALTP